MYKSRTRWLASVAALAAIALAIVLAWNAFGPEIDDAQPSVEGTPTPVLRIEPVTISFACPDYRREWYASLARAFHDQHPEIAVEILSADEILDVQETSTEVSRETSRTDNPDGPSTGSSIAAVSGTYTVTRSGDEFEHLARAADTFERWARSLGDRPQDAVLDLAELVADDESFGWDDFYPGALALLERDGKPWGLPFEVTSMLVFYHPALFDEAGVPYPEIGWTWEDLLDAASRLTVRGEEGVIRYGWIDTLYRHTPLLLAHQFGGPLLASDGEVVEARLDTPEVAAALRWYVDLVVAHEVAPNPAAVEGVDLQRMPYDQPAAMWTEVDINWDNFQREVGAGVVPFPERAGQAAANINGYGYFISAGTAHPEAAWRWIEFLSRQTYPYGSAVPARRSTIEAAGVWEKMDPALAAALQYNLEHAVSYPDFVGQALNRAVDAVLQGTSVETALTEAQTQAGQALAQRAADAARPAERFSVTGPEPTPQRDGASIRFSVMYSGEMEGYRPLVEQFHGQYPEMHVDLGVASDWRPEVQAREADCFVGYAGLTKRATGDLLALDPLLATDSTFDTGIYYPAFLAPLQVDGTLWGLPLDSDALLLYYNRDRFDKAGGPYPALDWTPQDMVDAALALTDLGGASSMYGFYPQNGALVEGATYVAWLGGQLFDEQGYPSFDDPTVVEALTLYADLISRASPPEAQERVGDRLSGITVSATWGSRPDWVRSGSVAMWTDSYSRHRSAPPLSSVGVVPLPKGAVSFQNVSRALFISRQTAYPEACWNWIAFLSAQPAVVRDLPVRSDVVTGDTWHEDVGAETASAWQAIAERGDAPLPPWISENSYVGSSALYWFDEALEEVLAGAPPAEALREAQDKAAAFEDCIGSGDLGEETLKACARQVDPGVTTE